MSHRTYSFGNRWVISVSLFPLGVFGGCSAEDSSLLLASTREAAMTSYSVSFQQGTSGYAGAMDSQISENAPTTNYGATTVLLSDGDEPYASGKDASTLIRWDLSSIPTDATVTSVTLRVQVTDGSVSAYTAYALNRSWSESSVSWNLASTGTSWQTAGAKGSLDRGTTAIASLSKSSAGVLTVTLNSSGVGLVQSWIASPSANYGLVIASTSNTDGLRIASSDDATVGNRPQLTVNYTRNTDAGTGGAPATGGSAATGGAATGGAATGGAATGVTQVIAAGDIADCSGDPSGAGRSGTALLLDSLSGPVLALGDSNNMDGSLSTYNSCFNPAWGRHKSRIRPVPGNHDYMTSGAQGYVDYYTSAVAKPNGKTYYSYDVGAWHVVALDANCTKVSGGCGTGSAQETWLRQDLAAHATAQHCTIAYWHQPRFTSGEHGPNANMQSIWQALNDHGVEMVLSGHDHDYERFYPMDATGKRVTNGKGVMQFVVGTGGASLRGFGTVAANSAVRLAQTYGVLKLTLRGTGFDWQFVPVAGSTGSDSGSRECYDP